MIPANPSPVRLSDMGDSRAGAKLRGLCSTAISSLIRRTVALCEMARVPADEPPETTICVSFTLSLKGDTYMSRSYASSMLVRDAL